MRTYAPAGTEAVLDRLLEEPSLAAAVKHHVRIPEREAITAPFPSWLDPRIVHGLEERGSTSLYSHQAGAIEAVHAGQDVVVVTPAAPGKTRVCGDRGVKAAGGDGGGLGSRSGGECGLLAGFTVQTTLAVASAPSTCAL